MLFLVLLRSDPEEPSIFYVGRSIGDGVELVITHHRQSLFIVDHRSHDRN